MLGSVGPLGTLTGARANQSLKLTREAWVQTTLLKEITFGVVG
jgi:hypothetical protein